MKKLIQNYTFNAATKKVTFSDYSVVNLESVLLITNVTSNAIIYNFADPAFGGIITANVLTLTYDTAAMNDADRLQIFYDDGLLAASDTSVEAVTDALLTLKRIAKNMESLQVVDSAQRQRVVVETIANMGSLNQCNILATLNGVDPKYNMADWARTAYNVGIRANLTF